MMFVAPNILTDVNFAEIVEDESHPTLKLKFVKDDYESLSQEIYRDAFENLSEVEYQRYKDIFESTHIIEFHSPPPNC